MKCCKISYKEMIVTFELFLSDKYDEKEIKYWYKLEGFDLEWVHSSRPSVTYSLLEPGTYVFKVKRSLVKEGEITKTVEESVKMIINPRPRLKL